MTEDHEDLDRLIADLNQYSTVKLHVAMNGAYADFVLYGGKKAAELEAAGFHEQAVELRRRLSEMMPDAAAMPPLTLPQSRPAVPSLNGTAPDPLSGVARRGR